MIDSITIELQLPPKQLGPNARTHWAARSRYTHSYRAAALWGVMDALDGKRERWPGATAKATFYWPDKRRRDIDNAEASLKAAWDGIRDSGLIPDDRAGVLDHEPTEFAVDRENPRVVIELKRKG